MSEFGADAYGQGGFGIIDLGGPVVAIAALPYRVDLPWPERGGLNAGCPPGYFAQIDANGAPRCRLMATATPGAITSESAPSWGAWLETVIGGGVEDTARDLRTMAPALGAWGVGLGVAAVALVGVVVLGGLRR